MKKTHSHHILFLTLILNLLLLERHLKGHAVHTLKPLIVFETQHISVNYLGRCQYKQQKGLMITYFKKKSYFFSIFLNSVSALASLRMLGTVWFVFHWMVFYQRLLAASVSICQNKDSAVISWTLKTVSVVDVVSY